MSGQSNILLSYGEAAASNGLLTGLISYWKLDEASGTIYDSHGANDGINNGAAYGATGIINDCLDFDLATTDDVQIAYTGDFNFGTTDSFSLSIWAYLDTASIYQALITNQPDSGQYQGWYLAFDNANAVQFIHRRLATTSRIFVDTNDSVVTTATWYHICLTYSGSGAASGVKIYVNGSSQSLNVINDTLTGTVSSAQGVRIGSRATSSNYFDGQIDEVGIWSRELDSTDVTALYNSGSGLAYPSFTS